MTYITITTHRLFPLAAIAFVLGLFWGAAWLHTASQDIAYCTANGMKFAGTSLMLESFCFDPIYGDIAIDYIGKNGSTFSYEY